MTDSLRITQQYAEAVGVGSISDKLRITQQYVELVGVGAISNKLRVTQQYVEVICCTQVVFSPAADISTGNWTNEADGTVLYPSVAELAVNDSTYIKSSPLPINDTCELAFDQPLLNDAGSFVVPYRYGKDEADGTRVDLTFSLMEGATQRATWTHADVPGAITYGEYVLTAAEVASIIDFDNLSLRITANSP